MFFPTRQRTVRRRFRSLSILVFGSLILLSAAGGGQMQEIPHLKKQGTATQLIVSGKPYLILGGELGNSTASSLEYLWPSWSKLQEMHVNTILAPVYWELIEPNEGRFEFSLVDGLLRDARRHQIKLVLLWFGTWKNSMSCYVPSWVKKDLDRFPRAQDKQGRGMEMLTSFDRRNLEADKTAFRALMQHLREVDGKDHTVIMVQVENEIGMIPEARDHRPEASTLFGSPVPAALMTYLSAHASQLQPELSAVWKKNGSKRSGTWNEVFGEGLHADEIFTAWSYAQYTDEVTKAGKEEYPLPMFVNAALIREGYRPGQYPSGGPLPHLLDIWKAGAPSVDFFAPDIYHGSFVDWTTKFHQAGNPLFIPEAGLSHRSAADAFYAFGQHDAMGFSPFAIESAGQDVERLTRAYDVLKQLTPLILEKQGRGMMAGISADSTRPQTSVTVGEHRITASYEALDRWAIKPSDADARGGCIIIQLGPDEFVIAGSGVIVTFESLNADRPIGGILSVDEGTYKNGVWQAGRRLNGDQTHQGRHLRLPYGSVGIQRVVLYQYR